MEKKRDWFGSCLVALSTVYVLCLFAWGVNVYAGCDIDSYCKTLARSSVALAEGRSATSVTVPMKIPK